MAGRWNTRNPAVKRLVQELREISRDDDLDISAQALEDNIFEWHFVIRGAWDSEFEGGIYHGRILMPADYPFKPPAFVMLTPSGRFETGVKICLSISSHHPESWQPSWSVRSALVALIAFMQTPGNGALGSLDHPEEARRQMAAESRARPPTYGGAERQQLIADMHQRMLDGEAQSCQLSKQGQQQPAEAAAESTSEPAAEPAAAAAAEPATEAAAQQEREAAAPAAPAAPQMVEAPQGSAELVGTPLAASNATPAAAPAATKPAAAAAGSSGSAAAPAAATPPAAAELRRRPVTAPVQPSPPPALPPPQPQPALQLLPAPRMHAMPHAGVPHHSWEDRGLTYLAALLVLCIAALLIRKVLVSISFQSDDLYNFNHVEGVEL